MPAILGMVYGVAVVLGVLTVSALIMVFVMIAYSTIRGLWHSKKH